MKKFIAILSIVALASCGGSQEAAPAVDTPAVETVDTAAAAADTAAAAADTAAAAAPAATN